MARGEAPARRRQLHRRRRRRQRQPAASKRRRQVCACANFTAGATRSPDQVYAHMCVCACSRLATLTSAGRRFLCACVWMSLAGAQLIETSRANAHTYARVPMFALTWTPVCLSSLLSRRLPGPHKQRVEPNLSRVRARAASINACRRQSRSAARARTHAPRFDLHFAANFVVCVHAEPLRRHSARSARLDALATIRQSQPIDEQRIGQARARAHRCAYYLENASRFMSQFMLLLLLLLS